MGIQKIQARAEFPGDEPESYWTTDNYEGQWATEAQANAALKYKGKADQIPGLQQAADAARYTYYRQPIMDSETWNVIGYDDVYGEDPQASQRIIDQALRDPLSWVASNLNWSGLGDRGDFSALDNQIKFLKDNNYDTSTLNKGALTQYNLTKQIIGQGTTDKWSGVGFGTPVENAKHMASTLMTAGIDDIKDFGKVKKTYSIDLGVAPEYRFDGDNAVPTGRYVFTDDADGSQQFFDAKDVTFRDAYDPEYGMQKAAWATVQLPMQEFYGNKKTQQPITQDYDQASGNVFSGTYTGEGRTNFGVQFGPDGTPYFYTRFGGDTSNAGDIMPLVTAALTIFAPGVGTAIGAALGATGTAATILGGAIVSGIMAEASGGDFVDGAIKGAVGAGVAATVAPGIASAVSDAMGDSAFRNLATTALTGAATSVVTAAMNGQEDLGAAALNGALNGAASAAGQDVGAAVKYDTNPFSQQTEILRAQDSGLDPAVRVGGALGTAGLNIIRGADPSQIATNALTGLAGGVIGDAIRSNTTSPKTNLPERLSDATQIDGTDATGALPVNTNVAQADTAQTDATDTTGALPVNTNVAQADTAQTDTTGALPVNTNIAQADTAQISTPSSNIHLPDFSNMNSFFGDPNSSSDLLQQADSSSIDPTFVGPVNTNVAQADTAQTGATDTTGALPVNTNVAQADTAQTGASDATDTAGALPVNTNVAQADMAQISTPSANIHLPDLSQINPLFGDPNSSSDLLQQAGSSSVDPTFMGPVNVPGIDNLATLPTGGETVAGPAGFTTSFVAAMPEMQPRQGEVAGDVEAETQEDGSIAYRRTITLTRPDGTVASYTVYYDPEDTRSPISYVTSYGNNDSGFTTVASATRPDFEAELGVSTDTSLTGVTDGASSKPTGGLPVSDATDTALTGIGTLPVVRQPTTTVPGGDTSLTGGSGVQTGGDTSQTGGSSVQTGGSGDTSQIGGSGALTGGDTSQTGTPSASIHLPDFSQINPLFVNTSGNSDLLQQGGPSSVDPTFVGPVNTSVTQVDTALTGGDTSQTGGSGNITTTTTPVTTTPVTTSPSTNPQASNSTDTAQGALPIALSPSLLQAAPVTQEDPSIMLDLQQLFPQLTNVDPRLMQVLTSRNAKPSYYNYGQQSNAQSPLMGASISGLPSAGIPVRATSNAYSPLGAGVASGNTRDLLSGGMSMLGGGGGGLSGYATGGGVEGHNPQFITGKTGYYVRGEGDGQSDSIPAMLADGEYVFDADTVAALGNGSNEAGARVLDKMRESIRKHKRSAKHGEIPPPAKSPLAYMKG